MARRIRRREVGTVAPALAETFHPVLARVFAARRVDALTDLDYGLERLHPVQGLEGIEDAVALLEESIAAGGRILVVGDYDADGATACAVAVRGLRSMGAAGVDYLVPNRFEFGYGLTPEIVEVALRREPDLIVTVDNGISSVAGVAAARERGVPVLVTDHHLPPDRLPEAAAIVNPNCPGDAFPSKCLAGVGVVFYVLVALRTHLRRRGWFAEAGIPEPNLARLLDLVALGTIADVVALDHNNRILVAQGLARIRRGNCQPGVRALLDVAARATRRVSASDLAFAVAPRLNAAGRLTDMSLGVECLLADDETAARDMAETLDRLNRERREIEATMREEALAQLEVLLRRQGLEEERALPFGLCLFDASWHPGVVGIVASRIKERLHRPVIAFAPDGDATLKGSARSVAGVHVRDAVDAVAASRPGLVERFGGHAMAAGLTLKRENLDAFREAFDAEVRQHLTEDDLHGTLLSDGPLEAEDMDLALAKALRSAGPWGQGFPEPLFDGEFRVLERRVVGGSHLKLRVAPRDARRTLDAIAFNAAMEWPQGASLVRLAYRLDVNEYRGTESAQLVVEHAEPVE